MKKKHIIFLIGAVIIFALIICALLSKYNIKKMDIVFVTNNSLMSYNIGSEETTQIEFNEYTTFYVVGPYSEGDYCCVAQNNDLSFEVLFVENNEVIRTYPLELCPNEIISNNDKIFCLIDNDIFCIDMKSDEFKLYAKNVYIRGRGLNMFLSDDGQLLYLQEDKKGYVNLVCNNGNIIELCEAKFGLGFVSSSEFLYKDENYKNKVINIYSKKTDELWKYRKCAGPVIFSDDKINFASFYYTGEPGGFGILGITNKISLIKSNTNLDNFTIISSFVIV